MDIQRFEPELFWGEGQLLYPQHFESLTDFLLYNVYTKNGILPFPWGVCKVECEIIGNSFHLRDYYVVMPDGLLLANQNSTVQEVLQLPDPATTEKDHLVIYLVRREKFTPRHDESISHKIWELQLVEKEKLKDLQNAIPIVQIKKTEVTIHNYIWEKDTRFIPPTFKVSRDSYLFSIFNGIMDKIKQSIANFPSSQSAEALQKFQAMYHCLSEYVPFQTANLGFSPFSLYMACIRTLGILKGVLEVATERKFDFPVYDHYNLTDTFHKLYQKIFQYVETIVLSKYIEKNFEKLPREKRFKIKLPAASKYYVLVLHTSDAQIQWLGYTTIGYEEEIAALIAQRYIRFNLKPTVNPEITDYREGKLYLLAEGEKNLAGTEERTLVIAGHTDQMPERLVLLYET